MIQSGNKYARKQDLPKNKITKEEIKVDNPQLQQILDDLNSKDISKLRCIGEINRCS